MMCARREEIVLQLAEPNEANFLFFAHHRNIRGGLTGRAAASAKTTIHQLPHFGHNHFKSVNELV
jgi:hypothetical protein